jgi:hypothetical protein
LPMCRRSDDVILRDKVAPAPEARRGEALVAV